MRLVVNRDLFEPNSPEEAVALVTLLSTIASQEIPSPVLLTAPIWNPEADNGPIDTWLAQRPANEAFVFRKTLSTGLIAHALHALTSSHTAPGNLPNWHLGRSAIIYVERRPISDWTTKRLTLADAAALVREPLHLLLENRRNDLTFLKHLAGPTSGQTLSELDSAPGRLEILNGGCGEIKKWLEDLNLQKDADPSSSAWRKLLRTWVMFDRDSGDNDAHQPSKNSLALLELLKQIHDDWEGGPSWVCLGRREVESYVPDEGLKQAAGISQHRAFADKVIQWRGDPDHFPWAWIVDLKKGLRGDLRSDLATQIREDLKNGAITLSAPMLKSPFDTLDLPDVQLLEHGFGSQRLMNGMSQNPPPPWVNSIPAEYDRGPSGQPSRLELIHSLFDRV